MAKMNDLIQAQGAKPIDLTPGTLCHEVLSEQDGVVTHIDNFQMAKIARIAGAPMDKKAGVDLLKKLGDKVHEGEPIYRIHAEFPADFKFAQKLAAGDSGYTIGNEEHILKPLVPFY